MIAHGGRDVVLSKLAVLSVSRICPDKDAVFTNLFHVRHVTTNTHCCNLLTFVLCDKNIHQNDTDKY